MILQLFKDYQGTIQTDGYAGYNILEKLEGITTLGCWVHTRRYFDRALSHDKARAEYALAQIGMLYDVESMADDQHMDTLQRMELRKRLAYPIIRAFEKWCICEQGNVLPKSPIGKAIGYFLMECCKAANMDFKQWMNYFLNHVYEYDSDYSKDLVNLLQHSLKEQSII